jgi:hypothetical protein
MSLIPSSLVRPAHKEEVNWRPWSEVMMVGTPNLAAQDDMRAFTQSSAAMDFEGAASSHLDNLSTIVNKYLKPSANVWRGPKQVYLHVGEALLWYRYWLDRSSVLWAGLATCTELTVSTPRRHILRHATPDHAGRHQPPRGTYAGVGQFMDRSENVLAVRHRDDGPRLTGRDITDDLPPLHLYVTQL